MPPDDRISTDQPTGSPARPSDGAAGDPAGTEAAQADNLPRPLPEGSLLKLLTAGLDRDAPISLGVQLRGVIEYGILMGSLPPGTRLPTVREFAESIKISPMSVVQVYNKLKSTGLIETRGKAGTFVTEGGGLPAYEGLKRLNQAIDDLLIAAGNLGLDATQAAELTAVRGNLMRVRSTMPLRILFVGLFEAATRDYAQFVQDRIGETDRVHAATIGSLQDAGPLLGYDLILTLANRRQELQAKVPATIPILGVNFVPSVETRTRLAGLDARARVGIVSTFPEFTGLMRLNIMRFISHVNRTDIIALDAPGLESFVRNVDVVVYATGSERVCDYLGRDQTAFEYRHAPDPNNIQDDIIPVIEKIRAAKQLSEKSG